MRCIMRLERRSHGRFSQGISSVERTVGMHRSSISLAALAVGVAWIAATATGFFLLQVHASRGHEATSQAVAGLPSELRGKLVVFAHPHCPCFRSSLANFAEVVKLAAQGGKAEVIFVRPEGTPECWEQGRAWIAAGALSLAFALSVATRTAIWRRLSAPPSPARRCCSTTTASACFAAASRGPGAMPATTPDGEIAAGGPPRRNPENQRRHRCADAP